MAERLGGRPRHDPPRAGTGPASGDRSADGLLEALIDLAVVALEVKRERAERRAKLTVVTGGRRTAA